jgi:hypothetical protein
MPGRVPEPNKMSKGQELCAAANLTQSYGSAWGWSDEPCALRFPSICEQGGCSPAAAAAARCSRCLPAGAATRVPIAPLRRWSSRRL